MAGLMARLSHRAWLDWCAYFEAEPWGEERADVRSAIVAATTYNMSRARGQAARPVRDFMAHPPPRADVTKAHTAALIAALRPLARPKDANAD